MTGLWTALTAIVRCFTQWIASVSSMAKKILPTKMHRQCKHCRQIDYEYLNYNGEPIMGECVYCKNRFLLNEKIDCKEFGY